MWVKAKWLVLWSLWAARLARQPTAPLRVSGGRLRGSVAPDGSHVAYLAIPYASLTEDNRFQAPGPEPSWDDEFEAVDDKVMCLQRTKIGGILMGREHCLTLNVYTPVFSSDTKLPVMVFIHGGGFLEGSGTPLLYGPDYLVAKGVIVVTFNYRLNAQGFLSLGIREAPGNAGMKDQVAALKWVQKNINVFGGDPDNVTIFGESAGGASVSYHVLSPMSAGLFHKAITQSGSSLAPWAVQASPEHNAQTVARAMGYNAEDPHELYRIFKSMPLEEQTKVNLHVDAKKIILEKVIYAPSIEKIFEGVEPFLTKDPHQILINGEFNKVPMIVGTNDEEGYFFTGLEDPSFFSSANIDIGVSLPNNLAFSSETERKRIANEIKAMYMGDERISDSVSAKKKLSRFYGEPFFNYPSMAETELLVKTNDHPVYHYLLKYNGWRNFAKFLIAGMLSTSGTSHLDDIFYLFHQPFFTAWFDMEMINSITTLWTNFAKTGDPTPATPGLVRLRWPPVTQESPQAFVLDREVSTIPLWHRESLKYWKNVYSKHRKAAEVP